MLPPDRHRLLHRADVPARSDVMHLYMSECEMDDKYNRLASAAHTCRRNSGTKDRGEGRTRREVCVCGGEERVFLFHLMVVSSHLLELRCLLQQPGEVPLALQSAPKLTTMKE